MRIGPRMRRCMLYDGCKRIDAARGLGPHGSLRYGYAIVARAVRAGLVRLRYGMGSNGQFVAYIDANK